MEALQKVQNSAELEQLKVKVLGRKGELTQQMRLLGKMSPEERPAFWPDGQCRKGEVDCGHGKDGGGLKKKRKKRHPLCQRGSGRNGAGYAAAQGSYHPLSLVLQDIRDTFLEMGFSISEGPEIELDHYNFELLNIP